jgi:hypothetical protein
VARDARRCRAPQLRINLKATKELLITVPLTLLGRTDEVIE